VEELAPRVPAGDERDGAARHTERLGDELQQLIVGAALLGGSREADAQATVGDVADLVAARARRDPDGEAQAVARFCQRPAVTT
jgi:hypothetical protein